ncbi:MAG TPA: hypothetical protein VHK24_08670 [Steroidobacter sp.]|nr:hypothetical protein [Steroidobacter sp.]
MRQARAWLGQALLYAAFAIFIGAFSRWPTYEHLGPQRALIKLSFIHHGKRLQECRTVPPEELAKLPPNMRAPMDCPRERAPIIVEVDVDGALALREVAEPTGVSNDGAASVYRRLEVAAGRHQLAVRLRDSSRASGFDFERTETITLRPAQVLVIDFHPEQGGITLL